MSEELKVREFARRFYWNGSLDGGLGIDTDRSEQNNLGLCRDFIDRMTSFGLALLDRYRAADAELARLRKFAEETAALEWGCASGDCPHMTTNQCYEAMAVLLRETARAASAALKGGA